jgi:hypothetical protein
MMTVTILILVAALIVTILSAVRPAWPLLWVAVLLLCLWGLVEKLPK